MLPERIFACWICYQCVNIWYKKIKELVKKFVNYNQKNVTLYALMFYDEPSK